MPKIIASNAASIALVRGAPIASRVLLLLAMTRFASPPELARAAYAIAIAEAVRVVAGGGLEISAIREIGRASETQVSRCTAAVGLAKLLLGFGGALVAGGLTLYLGDGGVWLALCAGMFVLAGEAFGVAVIYFLARGTPASLIPVSALLGVLGTGSGAVALVLGAGSVGVCAIIAVSETIASLYVLGKLRAARLLPFFPGLLARSIDVLRQCLPTTAYGGIVALYSRLDAIVLNATSLAAFTSYTVAFRITQPFTFVFGAIALAAYASQVGSSRQHDAQGQSGFRRLLVVMFGLGSLAAVTTYFVCGWIISALMPAYLDSLAPLRWLCAVIPFAAVNTVGLYALAGAARFRALIGVVTLNLIATALLLWMLVPSSGAQGAAITVLAVQILSSAVLLVLSARRPVEPVLA